MLWTPFVAHLSALLERVDQANGPADEALTAYTREHPKLGARDRGQLANALFAALRHQRWWAALVAAHADSVSSAEAWALLAAQHMGWQAPEWTPAQQQWLAALPERMAAAHWTPAQRGSLPDWLWSALEAQGTVDVSALAEALATPAPLDLRVNASRTKRDKCLAALQAEGWPVAAATYSPWGLRLSQRRNLSAHAAWRDGTLEVQDEGSQLLAALVGAKRGETVVDFCAGAGGKTLALGAMMRDQGRLLALDTSAARLSAMVPRLTRAGLRSVYRMAIADEADTRLEAWRGKAARVLVDAPCSGLGTLRRSPELKARLLPQDISAYAERQQQILASASRLVQPGGRLVYATCSLLTEENEAVAQAFDAQQLDFKPVAADAALAPWLKDAELRSSLCAGPYLRLWPHVHQSDGFFAAVWQRRA